MWKKLILISGLLSLLSCISEKEKGVGSTMITKWQGAKKAAISITYDDGTITQFTVAKPIMDRHKIPGTFYILTGKIKGSEQGKFIGRPQEEIIEETQFTKTNKDNFFERASLIAFTGTTEAVDYHSNAGSRYEAGKVTEAYKLIDEGFSRIRNGTIKNTDDVVYHDNPVDTTSWEDLKAYAKQGHEIASHTVTHPRLAVLDEKNLLFELEQSKKDIEHFLGKEYTFSAECPYGTEDERVMEYAQKIYPALRNRMPEPYLEELNRGSNTFPGESEKEYVQWQRGPLTKTSMNTMKGWVDTCLTHDNIWLVLVFHGVNGIGWESKQEEELEEYFGYIHDQREEVWVATFADVTKYIRQRKNTVVESKVKGKQVAVRLTSSLDPEVYNVPLTLKTYIPSSWEGVSINGGKVNGKIRADSIGKFVTYEVLPGEKEFILLER